MSKNTANNSDPIAIVDKYGAVWPWDSRVRNDLLTATGSRLIYTKRELKEAMKEQASGQQVETITDPAVIDPQTELKKLPPVNQKEVVKTILGE